MVQRDRQAVVVEPPQLAEHDLGLGPRIDEDQRGACRADPFEDLLERVNRHVAGPGQTRAGAEDLDVRPGAAAGLDHMHRCVIVASGRRQPSDQGLRVVHGGRESDPSAARRQGLQAGEAERQQVAALVVRQGVQLVDNHRVQAGEDLRRVVVGQQ